MLTHSFFKNDDRVYFFDGESVPDPQRRNELPPTPSHNI